MVFEWESAYGGANRPAGPYRWFEQTYSLAFADEARSDWSPTPKYHQIGPEGGIYEWWGYPTIRRLNIFLEQLAPMDLDEPYKSNRMAEARYLRRSEEHTSELQSIMRISYAVFGLKKKKQ